MEEDEEYDNERMNRDLYSEFRLRSHITHFLQS